jgi:hypothetical protein
MFVISIVIRADVLYYYAICLCVRNVSGFVEADCHIYLKYCREWLKSAIIYLQNVGAL